MSDETGCRYLIPGLDRGLQLLLAFGQQQREMTFTELHRLVSMPKATAYRVVQTLEYLGFLERNPRTNTFSLGMMVLRLGFEYLASLDVARAGQPVIEQLRDASLCSSHLAIRDGSDLVYIARVSAAGTQINQVSIGTRLPAHCTSLGRMLLTDLNRSEFEQLYPDPILPGSEQGTLQDRDALWEMVQLDRQRGYVVGESFFRWGISSIVYPVFDRNRRVCAVVSILVPAGEIPDADRKRLQQMVADAAAKISGYLGHRLKAG
ncbi:IclR family transcriptional regulator [Erwinia persicina]|uniref:IclR family transcriptional regulator n=1 Tax=Erwinia persicina TaxID=55211 RepID=UPI001781E16D|nr:IclR family transcriptional regulator [Erwinia persicina]MBD8162637.1 IclR family transcriptional regulator [Erwinia persicina]MBD8214719.1 IclR family transcriptional regulator [Erwinia persicina]